MSNDPDPLDTRLRGLPRSIEPDRDLWPEIRAGLDAAPPLGPRHADHPAPRAGRRVRPAVAAGLAIAAALVLTFLIGVVVGPMLTDRTDAPLAQNTPARPEPASPQPAAQTRSGAPTRLAAPTRPAAPTQPAAAELVAVRRALAARIRERLPGLPEDTRLVVASNLAAIDQALDRIDAALRQTPDADPDSGLLLAVYADQVALLYTMNDLVTRPVEEVTL